MRKLEKIGLVSIVVAMMVGINIFPSVSGGPALDAGTMYPSNMWNTYVDWKEGGGGVAWTTHAVMNDNGYFACDYTSSAWLGNNAKVFANWGKAGNFGVDTSGYYTFNANWVVTYNMMIMAYSGNPYCNVISWIRIIDETAGGTVESSSTIVSISGFNGASATDRVISHTAGNIHLIAGHSYVVVPILKMESQITSGWLSGGTLDFSMTGYFNSVSWY